MADISIKATNAKEVKQVKNTAEIRDLGTRGGERILTSKEPIEIKKPKVNPHGGETVLIDKAAKNIGRR